MIDFVRDFEQAGAHVESRHSQQAWVDGVYRLFPIQELVGLEIPNGGATFIRDYTIVRDRGYESSGGVLKILAVVKVEVLGQCRLTFDGRRLRGFSLA